MTDINVAADRLRRPQGGRPSGRGGCRQMGLQWTQRGGGVTSPWSMGRPSATMTQLNQPNPENATPQVRSPSADPSQREAVISLIFSSAYN